MLDAVRLPVGAFARALGPAQLLAEVKFLTWTEDGLPRQVVYEGVREDKPAREVVRSRSPT